MITVRESEAKIMKKTIAKIAAAVMVLTLCLAATGCSGDEAENLHYDIIELLGEHGYEPIFGF
jgi:hypothetical protein